MNKSNDQVIEVRRGAAKPEGEPAPDNRMPRQATASAGELSPSTPLRLRELEPVAGMLSPAEAQQPGSAEASASGASRPQLSELVLLTERAAGGRFVRHGESIGMRLIYDLGSVSDAPSKALDCSVTVYAKNLDGGPRECVAEVHRCMVPAKRVAFEVAAGPLPPGMYRLEVALKLDEGGSGTTLATTEVKGPMIVY